jgi:hypothetical protein
MAEPQHLGGLAPAKRTEPSDPKRHSAFGASAISEGNSPAPLLLSPSCLRLIRHKVSRHHGAERGEFEPV